MVGRSAKNFKISGSKWLKFRSHSPYTPYAYSFFYQTILLCFGISLYFLGFHRFHCFLLQKTVTCILEDLKLPCIQLMLSVFFLKLIVMMYIDNMQEYIFSNYCKLRKKKKLTIKTSYRSELSMLSSIFDIHGSYPYFFFVYSIRFYWMSDFIIFHWSIQSKWVL